MHRNFFEQWDPMGRVFVPYFSLFVLHLGVIVGIITALFVFTVETTTGTITSTKTKVSEEGETLYHPTFVFAVKGRDYTITPSGYVAPSPGDVGETVPVLYDPRNPTNARIDQFVYTWGFSVTLTVFGLFYGVGFLVVRYVVRFFRSKAPEGDHPQAPGQSNRRVPWIHQSA